MANSATEARNVSSEIMLSGNSFRQAERATSKRLISSFSEKLDLLKQRGISDIIIDPGFCFGKTLEQNYALIAHFEVFHHFQLPIMVGISRKSMIQKVIHTSAEESLNGTTALHTLLIEKGAHILRVHDVKEATEVIALTEKLKTIHHDF